MSQDLEQKKKTTSKKKSSKKKTSKSKNVIDSKLNDFKAPKREESSNFEVSGEDLEGNNLRKTIKKIQEIQEKLSVEWKKRTDKSLIYHRKLNEAIVGDITGDLLTIIADIKKASANERETITLDFKNISQKLTQSKESTSGNVTDFKENIAEEMGLMLADFNKNVSMGKENISENLSSILLNKRSSIQASKIQTEKSLTGDYDTYRLESENNVKRFSRNSNEAMEKVVSSAADTFKHLKYEFQTLLTSYMNDTESTLSSFSTQSLDALSRNKVSFTEGIENARGEKNGFLVKGEENLLAQSLNFKMSLGNKIDTLKNGVHKDILEFRNRQEELQALLTEKLSELIENSNKSIENEINRMKKSLNDGLSNVTSLNDNILKNITDSVTKTSTENNEAVSTFRDESSEFLSNIKNENVTTSKELEESLKTELENQFNNMKKYLNTTKTNIFETITNYGTNQKEKFIENIDSVNTNLEKTVADSNSRFDLTVNTISGLSKQTFEEIEGHIKQMEQNTADKSASTLNFLKSELGNLKNNWNQESDQTINQIKEAESLSNSSVSTSSDDLVKLVGEVDAENLNIMKELIESNSNLTESIFDKALGSSEEKFKAAEAMLQKNIKTTVENASATSDNIMNQSDRRINSAKDVLDSAIHTLTSSLNIICGNIIKKTRDSSTENQDLVIEFVGNVISQLNISLDGFHKELNKNLDDLIKKNEISGKKGEKKIMQVTEETTNYVIESIENFVRDYTYQKNVIISRLDDILQNIPVEVGKVQTKWKTQQENDIMLTYSNLQEEYRELQALWEKIETESLKKMNKFIPKG
jgi:hypothetical protein